MCRPSVLVSRAATDTSRSASEAWATSSTGSGRGHPDRTDPGAWAFDLAFAEFDRLVHEVPADGWYTRSGCPEWTLRDLANQVTVGSLLGVPLRRDRWSPPRVRPRHTPRPHPGWDPGCLRRRCLPLSFPDTWFKPYSKASSIPRSGVPE
ncbi:maleylpyruvate isomerase N-terminal domain-containing protein [Streptomyces shenzhenensis]